MASPWLRRASALALVAMAGCAPQDDNATCEALCSTLVTSCEFDAYPSLDSCLQGCAYEGSLGADLEKESTCIADAECDIFQVVGCQHRYGSE